MGRLETGLRVVAISKGVGIGDSEYYIDATESPRPDRNDDPVSAVSAYKSLNTRNTCFRKSFDKFGSGKFQRPCVMNRDFY